MLKFNTPLIRSAMLAAVLGSFAVSAQAQDTAPAAPAPAATHAKHAGKQHEWMNVESRIQTLHDKLKITPDQESDWANVAQAMRDNEKEIHELIEERKQNAESQTAIDDLKSYQKITQAHVDGLKNMISSFETLYDEMSDDQKKNADDVFGKFEGHRDGGMHAKSSK